MRERATMSDGEIGELLAASRKMQLATINRDGTPHLVTMFYTLLDGRIAFWTYEKAQKARNLDRDPRVTCLVETGEDYFELRGVQVVGVVERIDDADGVLTIGTRIAAGMMDVPGEVLSDYVAHTARKRVAYLVTPTRVVSWDHGKLPQ